MGHPTALILHLLIFAHPFPSQRLMCQQDKLSMVAG